MIYIFSSFLFFLSFGFCQTVQLNEIVASNSSTLFDEDGDTPDWIEIHNPTETPIDLFDFSISDDPNDLSKWLFPSINIGANEFLIVFASDKNRKDIVLEWDGIIDWGDEWSFWIGDSEPISDWELTGTDISFWEIGNSGFGYGDNDDNTQTGQVISVYIKKEFIVEDPSIVLKALFHIDYDDGYVSYLNGVEFSRKNLGQPGTTTFYNTTTSGLHEAEIYAGGFPEKVEIDLSSIPLVSGTNTLAVEVHNYSANSSDLSCIPFLTLGYSVITDTNSVPNQLLNLPNSYLHTNFRISSNGETLLLSNQNEIIIDSITVGEINTDMSFGRRLEGNSWALFNTPTPGTSNTYPPFSGLLATPEFSIETGFYEQSQIPIEITTSDDLATIHYTLDGRIPTISDDIYTSPIIINSNTVIRAGSFLDGWVPSEIETKTYMMNDEDPNQLPRIFLTTDPNSFFDEDTGIYVLGPNAEWNFPHFGANFWEDWERPIHFEIIETDGNRYSANAGVKIFGGWSRGFPQKSLSIFSRSHIGPSSFDYQLFPNSDIASYEAFVLRNSGNDWESTMLRDGFITSIAKNLNIDSQQYRPAILYINGVFWGIQNLREKVNEHFIASHHSIPSEHIDLLDLEGLMEENIINGTNIDYQNLIHYLENEDITDPLVKNALENWIDIESYMSYQAFQIYVDNRDWPGNNIKFWRDHRVGGKWRWVLYDTDFGFGIWDPNAYTFNTLEFALEPNGPGWPNPPWSTFIFRKLIENTSFKHTFINIYCDMINTVFKQENLIPHLDSLVAKIENVIPAHRSRWYNNGNWPNSVINWQNKVYNMENYSIQRRAYAITHLQDEFNLPDIAQVVLSILPESGGKIKINSLDISESYWQGYYFPTVPLEIKAIQNDGYEFSHWLEYPDSNSTMSIDVTEPSLLLTAIFTETDLTPGNVVINEINYNSYNGFDTEDWIEIYNSGEMNIDISGWMLKDDDNTHSYIFPEETILNTNEFLIISNDINAFYEHYPSEIPVIGPFDFGLSGGGDEVRIFDSNNSLIDSVHYDDNDPWPNEPDGNGHTLELINPYIDNSLAESWASSEGYGSPGQQNSNFLSTIDFNIPKKHSLLPAYPNPFNGLITIPFELSEQIKSSIIIYNILGEEIQSFSIKNLSPGIHSISWSGYNKLGLNVGNGLYFVKLETNNSILTQKLIYLK